MGSSETSESEAWSLPQQPWFNETSGTLLNDTARPAIEGTWAALAGVGVGGNLLVAGAFLIRPWNRTPLQVDRVIGLLALTGLATTLSSLPTHLYSASGHGSMCQVQGFLLNLLCLLSLWYTTLLALERYVKFASPHEHSLTFSLLNLNVLLCGVLVLLLIEVSGPIYGWAEYGYVPECGVCVLNPGSTHILTYTAIQTGCYVMLPSLVTLAASAAVLRRCHASPTPLTRGSQVLKSAGGVCVLCCAMLSSVLLMLPYHLLLLLQAAALNIPFWAKVVSYWLKIVALTCVYPLVLLTARPRDVWPPLMATLRRLSQWQEGGGGPCRWQRRGQGAAEQQDVRLSSLDAHPPSDKNASFKLSRPPSPSNGDKDASVTRL
ncbi:uncharacterized protein LOC123511691 [Portunus trituberculatus]|uniref:uncharacterized protein LOC123511691 n=1 Tax=Portunus trituberculatus TaxID=210409 RepID=UPI001E1CB25E|nr:uncharacterized protein LOC123511691 [Portunus trituberculatus]